jgi:DNA repair exonuclease SbcCD nuclease subunit
MSVHQFAHGGDLHLGPNARNEDRRRAFDQFVREGLALPRLAAWLLPGDLNNSRMTIQDRNYLADKFTEMAARAPTIMCAGNHDLPDELLIFSKLHTAWPIYVVSAPTVLRIKVATGVFASIFCLPYPTPAGLIAAGVAPADVHQAAREALAAIIRDAGVQLADERARGEITLVIGHVNVGGSRTEAGQPNIGKELEVDASMLALLGPCYKGLNHIHKGQEIGGAWYPGSFCRLDWGEISPKRWLLIEYNTAAPRETLDDWMQTHLGVSDPMPEPETAVRLTPYTVTPQPLDVAPMYHVEGALSRDGFTGVVKDGPDGAPLEPPPSWAGCEVRVRATFPASERQMVEFARAHIYATYAEAARLEVELVALPDRQIRAPQVAAAKSLGDKIVAWAELEGVTVTEGLRQKLAELEHGDATVLLASLEERLTALVQAEKEGVAA